MDFVHKHQPELAKLLDHLQQQMPGEYAAALRDLDRTMSRLSQFQKRDPERYGLELERWLAQTRVQLFAARLQHRSSPKLLKQLRTALEREYVVRQQIVQREQKRVAARLRRLEKQVDELEANREQTIQRQLRVLTRKAERSTDGTNDSQSKQAKTNKPARAPD